MSKFGRWSRQWLMVIGVVLLSACGGDGGDAVLAPPPATAPTFTAQPSDAQVVAGGEVRFQASAQGTAVTWTWQRSSDNGATWVTVANAGTVSPDNSTAFLTLSAVTLADNTARFRAVAGSAGLQTLSSAATLTVSVAVSPPAISVQLLPQQALAGSTATFAITAVGTDLRYQWQSSRDGSIWADVPGATVPTLSLPALSADANGMQYRVVVRNSAGSVTSNPVTLSVAPPPAAPTFSLQPSAAAVTVPNTATFTVAATGQPAPTLQWQRSSNGGTSYADIPGATATSYTPPATTLADTGALFRAVASSSAGSTTSTAATLTVMTALAAPAISTQPQDAAVTVGLTASWAAAASGVPAPSFQWQLSSDGGTTFANINGATSTSFSLTAAAADNGRRVRVLASNSQGTATSRAAVLTVTAPASSRNASQYWLAGVAGFGANAVLYVIDPAQPDRPLVRRSVGESVGIWFATEAFTATGQGGRVVTTSSDVSWIEGGRLLYMSLLRTTSRTPRQLTQAADFCYVLGGSRSWRNGIETESQLLGRTPTGCTAVPVGLRYVYVPSTAQATDSAPVGWATVPYLFEDVTGASSIVVAMEPGASPGTFALGTFRKDGMRLSLVTGASGFTSESWFPFGVAEYDLNASLAIFGSGLAGDRVRRLNWTSTGASLGQPLHSLVSGRTDNIGSPPDASFLVDGTTVLAFNKGASSPTTLFTVPANSTPSLLPTATRISAAVVPTQGCPTARACLQVMSTPRKGGMPTTYTFEGTATVSPVAQSSGYDTDQLTIVQRTDAGLSNVLMLDLRTGTVRTLVSAAVYVGAILRSESRVGGGSEWAAVLFCEPSPGTSCAGRTVKQRSLDGLTTVDLGPAPASLSYQPSWLLYDAMPNAANFSVTDLFSHLYVVTPGVAGSLRLIAAQ